MNYVARKEGVIAANGDVVELDVRGTSSATISVQGAFTGTLEFVGANDDGSAEGGRLVMQSGVGSLGIYEIAHSGAIDREYRVVTGGTFLRVRGADWSSGSARISIVATDDPSMVFINGPVQTSQEQATRAGRAFLASIGQQSLTAAQEIYFTLNNPAESTRNLMISKRLFGAWATDELRYTAYANPTANLSTTGAIVNLRVGSAITSEAEFKYQVAAAGGVTMGGVTGSGEPIPIDGGVRERDLFVIINPGSGIGFSILGAGANIQNAAEIYSTLEWFEEDV